MQQMQYFAARGAEINCCAGSGIPTTYCAREVHSDGFRPQQLHRGRRPLLRLLGELEIVSQRPSW
jgi:hypothetical protein